MFAKLGIACLCLTTLSGCLVVSTAHLKENIFDRILRDNLTSPNPKVLKAELSIKLYLFAMDNNTNMSVVEYYEKNGGHCVYGSEITCKYQNEYRILLPRPIIGPKLEGGFRYTWIFKMKYSARKSGFFEVFVIVEPLDP